MNGPIKYLNQEEVKAFFSKITDKRDRALFTVQRNQKERSRGKQLAFTRFGLGSLAPISARICTVPWMARLSPQCGKKRPFFSPFRGDIRGWIRSPHSNEKNRKLRFSSTETTC